LGTPNDHDGVQRTGQARSINRRKLDLVELRRWISNKSVRRHVWCRYLALLTIRSQLAAFHPDAKQEALTFESPAVVGFLRTSVDGDLTILVAANVSNRLQQVDLEPHSLKIAENELITGSSFDSTTGNVRLEPCQVVWLPVIHATKRNP
jgi:sucrose phosphorylase